VNRRVKHPMWLGALAAVALGACKEDLVAPGEGTCPAFCPPEQVALVDSVLSGAIASDSVFDGYVLPWEAGGLHLLTHAGGATPTSRGVVKVLAFGERLLVTAGDTTTGPIVATDSFSVRATVLSRGGTGLELHVHRLPVTLDSTVSFETLDDSFADSTRVGMLAIPDSVVEGDTVIVRLDATGFPTFEADGRVVTLGLAVTSPGDGFVSLGALEGGAALQLIRYVQFDSAGTTVPRLEGRLPLFDTYATPPLPAPPADVLRIGGAPSARTLLRFAIPPRIVDSSRVVRATLVLVPAGPIQGVPGDSLRLIAQGLTTDVGAKSPLLGVHQDTIPTLLVTIPTGSTDTIRLDVTSLVLRWGLNPDRPRAVMVRAFPEGNSVAQALVGSTASATGQPTLHLTFVPPLTLGNR